MCTRRRRGESASPSRKTCSFRKFCARCLYAAAISCSARSASFPISPSLYCSARPRFPTECRCVCAESATHRFRIFRDRRCLRRPTAPSNFPLKRNRNIISLKRGGGDFIRPRNGISETRLQTPENRTNDEAERRRKRASRNLSRQSRRNFFGYGFADKRARIACGISGRSGAQKRPFAGYGISGERAHAKDGPLHTGGADSGRG